MSDVVKWLESPEGEYWSRQRHARFPGVLMAIKDDAAAEDEWLAVVNRLWSRV